MAMLAILGMFLGGEVDRLRAYNCAKATNRVDVYSLLEPVACPPATPHHAVERTIFGEIVQISYGNDIKGKGNNASIIGVFSV
jgi:hypothetical protein